MSTHYRLSFNAFALACGASVPLVRQTWLCKKKNKYVAFKVIPNYQTKQVEFEVVQATTEKELGFDPLAGSSRGNSVCRHCGTTVDIKDVKKEGIAGRIDQQLMAIVCTTAGKQGKTYLAGKQYEHYIPEPNALNNQLNKLCEETGLTIPHEPIEKNDSLNFKVPLYGLTEFKDLFTLRQLLALITFVKWVRLAHEEMMQQGYEEEFGKAIATYLGIMCDRIADYNSSITSWHNTGEKTSHTFTRQALPMVWDFVEINPLGNASGDEVMKIIQRRLFADVGDPDVIQEIARQQAELFRRFRESYEDTNRGKQEVQQQADLLAERIQSSYPFHPDLLDLMYHRWGSLPSYQRTRGALQFLARVVYALRQAGDTSLLIGPGNIPFDDEGVRGAFFSQVGERERFSSVIAADLIGRKAKVKAVDNRIAQDAPALASLKVGTRLASGILLYSFGVRNGEDRGVVEQEVIAACLAPGLDRNTITATLSDLREQLLYLHYVGRRYRFETKPNLNKLVADEEGKIAVDDVLEKIRVDLSKSLQNSRGKVVLWPKDSMAIADHVPQLSIVYLNPDWAEKSPEVTSGEALNWLEQRGKDKREYKNAIAFVVSNKVQMDKARKGAITALAIASLLEQKVKYKFTVEDTEELNGKVFSIFKGEDILFILR